MIICRSVPTSLYLLLINSSTSTKGSSLSFQLRATTILDLYLRGKLDLTRLGLKEGDSKQKIWTILLRTFAVRIFFFPILPITQFLKSIFSETFEKDYTFGVTDKYLESFAEASTQLLLNVYILVMTWRGPEHHAITLCAIVSSFISVSKTAAEGQAMWLLKKVPPISHWVPLFPYFVLTTLTRCLTAVVFISYLRYLSILPISAFFFTGIITGYFAGKQRGMSCFNCGPSSLLSSAFFTTLKESSTSSRRFFFGAFFLPCFLLLWPILLACRFYLWNTMVSFLIASTWISIMCILITLNMTPSHLVPGTLPVFSCYHPESFQSLTDVCIIDRDVFHRQDKTTTKGAMS